MEGYKSIFTSAKFWGVVVAAMVSVLSIFNITLPADIVGQLPDQLVQLIGQCRLPKPAQAVIVIIGFITLILGIRFEKKKLYAFKRPKAIPKFGLTTIGGIFLGLRVLLTLVNIYIFLYKKGLTKDQILERMKKLREIIGGVEYDDQKIDEIITP